MKPKKIAIAVSRVIISLLIAAAFLILLSVAAAQQEALAQLKANKSDYSYSVARNLMNEADRERGQLAEVLRNNDRLRGVAQRLERQKREKETIQYRQLQEVSQIARQIARSGSCETMKSISELPAVVDVKLWAAVQDCAQGSTLRKDLNDRIAALVPPAANPTIIQQAITALEQDINANRSQVTDSAPAIAAHKKAIADAGLVSDAFQDIRILDEIPVISWLGATSFPPPLMQILLSFVSGLFGALLLTLILAVYPHNDLDFVDSDSYWNRILLGGLIAVGVYVVIGGGVAVIGSTRALTSENANFMSFCAIGILSGMFSERVARSLSDRAKALLAAPRRKKPAKPPAKQPPAAGQQPAREQKEKKQGEDTNEQLPTNPNG